MKDNQNTYLELAYWRNEVEMKQKAGVLGNILPIRQNYASGSQFSIITGSDVCLEKNLDSHFQIKFCELKLIPQYTDNHHL